MEKLKDSWFKIIAIAMLLFALADNSYGYYQLLRWVITINGALSSYLFYNSGKLTWAFVFGIITLLFNPISPFYLSRDAWQIIDVIVAALFFISLFNKNEREK